MKVLTLFAEITSFSKKESRSKIKQIEKALKKHNKNSFTHKVIELRTVLHLMSPKVNVNNLLKSKLKKSKRRSRKPIIKSEKEF